MAAGFLVVLVVEVLAFAVFLAAVVANLAMIPHPLWMAATGVLGPAAALATGFALRRPRAVRTGA